jgi:CDP-glucose 4,6-dehydratase
MLDANVYGIALPSHTSPNHFELRASSYESHFVDILDFETLKRTIQIIRPDVIFHLAAQALVRESYATPRETVLTNVIGTINVFEAARSLERPCYIINVTTDKCYHNTELNVAYTETDRLGGHDVYSASKACSELLTASYRTSFPDQVVYASARAGNVIGGGDWAADRLIPDIIRATQNGRSTIIRHPKATRPWQHVLEPLSGYLLLGQKLLEGDNTAADAWNFGPAPDLNLTVEELLSDFSQYWKLDYQINESQRNVHEAKLLMLDCSKAKESLGWHPVLNKQQMFEMTANWYRSYYEQNQCLTREQITQYINIAKDSGACWS